MHSPPTLDFAPQSKRHLVGNLPHKKIVAAREEMNGFARGNEWIVVQVLGINAEVEGF